MVIIFDGIRRDNKLEILAAMIYLVALVSLLLVPESHSLATANLIM